MALKESTGLRNGMLVTGSLRSQLLNGFLKIYSGTAPASADDAVTGTLLCTISVSSTGTGITLDTTASAGTVSKAPAETWSGVNAATGTAGYFRHVGSADTGASSTTQPRLQGDVATAGAELNFTSVALTSGATQTVDYYNVALPTL